MSIKSCLPQDLKKQKEEEKYVSKLKKNDDDTEYQKHQQRQNQKQLDEEKHTNTKTFNSNLQELRSFVYPQMNKKKSKQFENQRLLALGFKSLEKRQSCPLSILKHEQANRAKKTKKLQEKDKILGVSR